MSDMIVGEANRQRVEQLIPLEPEKEDSGIDSDDTERARDSQDDALKAMPDAPIMPWDQVRCQEHQKSEDSDDDRASILFEVELTASDEDDDGSVLELVIPVQNSRYHRVPNSSPKKMRPAPRLLCRLFCCVRSRK